MILIQKSDIKSNSWSKAASTFNQGEMVPVEGSPMKIPLILFKYLIKGVQVDAVVFRYLNDYPSLFRSILRALTDFLTLYSANWLGIKIFWICHNVDKESKSHHPYLTRKRRELLIKKAQKLFVLDQLLVEPAMQKLNVSRERIVPISFGENTFSQDQLDTASLKNSEILTRVIEWKLKVRSACRAAKIGLWIGSPSEKLFDGLQFLSKVSKNKDQQSQKLYFIVIGSIGEWLKKRDHELYEELLNSHNILWEDNFHEIPPPLWKNFSDFIFKPSSDFSVNLTMYNSASAGLPIVGFKNTFLGELITFYNLGVTIDPSWDKLNCTTFIKKIEEWETSEGRIFLQQKSWENSARKIFEALD